MFSSICLRASLVSQMVKNPPAMQSHKRQRFYPWIGKIPWRRKRQLIPEILPGKFHGQKSLVAYSPWGRKELDTTERLKVKVKSLSCVRFFVTPWTPGSNVHGIF